MANTFSVRFGIDHATSLPNTDHLSGWIQALLASVAPHVGIAVFNGINDEQFAKLDEAANIVKTVLLATGNSQAAANFVCEKR